MRTKQFSVTVAVAILNAAARSPRMVKNIVILLFLFFMASFVMSCGIKEGGGSIVFGQFEGQGLTVSTEKQILQTLAKEQSAKHDASYKADDFVITGYYGAYNGVVAITWDLNPAKFEKHCEQVPPWYEYIAGIKFIFIGESAGIRTWKDNKIYSLTESFNLSLLSQDDIEKIYSLYTIYITNNPFYGSDGSVEGDEL